GDCGAVQRDKSYIYLVVVYFDHLLFFFFQAEDGIRDRNVTGVQTCALPISRRFTAEARRTPTAPAPLSSSSSGRRTRSPASGREIGRASCRERVEVAGVAGAVQRKRRGPDGAGCPHRVVRALSVASRV